MPLLINRFIERQTDAVLSIFEAIESLFKVNAVDFQIRLYDTQMFFFFSEKLP